MSRPRNPSPEVGEERADHFLGLPGANIVATEALLLTQDNLSEVIEAKAMMCVHGDAGLGKTLSVNAPLRQLAPGTVCRVQFRSRPTARDILHVLFDALVIGGSPPGTPIVFDHVLKDVLAERFRVLVCDEAQWLSRECFEYWRHLWDDRRTDIAIVFVGGGDCYQVLRVIPAYHPIWENTDPEVIEFAVAHDGHGNFRSWAKITAHADRPLQRLDRTAMDRDVLGWVFAKLSGRTA